MEHWGQNCGNDSVRCFELRLFSVAGRDANGCGAPSRCVWTPRDSRRRCR